MSSKRLTAIMRRIDRTVLQKWRLPAALCVAFVVLLAFYLFPLDGTPVPVCISSADERQIVRGSSADRISVGLKFGRRTSWDERQIVRRSSADDLPLICRRAAAHPQTVTLMTSFVGATAGDLQVARILPRF
ncbi:hypothetical protein B0H13DRAFT_2360722 [Mycena leptocephala]|nr:hypothetical protein B0H13DRAFT_2360722 [Mycena leptocephala]